MIPRYLTSRTLFFVNGVDDNLEITNTHSQMGPPLHP